MGRQVAQDAGLGLAERRGGATRPRRARPGEPAQDAGAQGGVRGALPGMALKQSRRRVDEGGEEHAVGLGEIQGPLDGALGGSGVAEQVAGDRLQQESFHQPDGMACPDGAGDDGRERATVAACGSSPASRSAAMTVRMTAGWRSWSSISARAASLAATAVWWASRTSPPRGSPRPRPPPLYAQNDNSEPSARSPNALGPPTRASPAWGPDSDGLSRSASVPLSTRRVLGAPRPGCDTSCMFP